MDCSKRSAGTVVGLPEDPLVEILSRVPAKSLCHFRCVCKAWRDFIDDPLNCRKLPQTLEGFFVRPRRRADGAGDVGHFDFINFSTRSVPIDIDRYFSFLTKLHEIQNLFYQDSCNGLFLFQHDQKSHPFAILGYIVCNPATKHWGTVPPCGCSLPLDRKAFLVFDPAVSSHFHLILFGKRTWDEEGTFENPLTSVHAYSSETGMWNHLDEQGHLEGWRHRLTHVCLQRAFVNGILHLIVTDCSQSQMVAVDVRGKTKRMITMPAVAEGRRWCTILYIGQSQGRLHYVNHDFDAHDLRMQSYELSIWILQDFDTQEWVLKDTVSFVKLFGMRTACSNDFAIVAIHPDCNVVFIQRPNRLIAYDMDRKEVSVVACLKNNKGYVKMAPYILYLSKSPALTDKN